mmetsp:Transcript_79679/g.258114  ORF Transcript_79679/g.258114 Transcript_79679/m.258114 type:complete len:233 (-) Transcript_79679:2348-3046(-)
MSSGAGFHACFIAARRPGPLFGSPGHWLYMARARAVRQLFRSRGDCLPALEPGHRDALAGHVELEAVPRAWSGHESPARLLRVAKDGLRAGYGHDLPGAPRLRGVVGHARVLVADDVEELLAHDADGDLGRMQCWDLRVLLHGVHAPLVECASDVESLAPPAGWCTHDLAPDSLAIPLNLHLEELADLPLVHRHAVGLPILGVLTEHQDVRWRRRSDLVPHGLPEVPLARAS